MSDSSHSTTTPTSGLRAVVAYVLPMGLFLGMSAVESRPFPVLGYPGLYMLKIIAVTAAWWFCRAWYPQFRSDSWRLGVVAGLVGFVIWVALSRLDLERGLVEFLPVWVRPGERAAYNPFEAIAAPVWQWAFVGIRLFGLAVTVPLMEEVFWRGFLLRYLIDPDFRRVPIGRWTAFSFAGVTILFAVAHPELLAAVIWCAGINGLLYWTKNLWACVIAHSVTNILLGLYVIQTGSWSFW